MRINKVTISNFRNIGGVSVWLNDRCSYIVGGNNIGKTNFLALLRSICEGNRFETGDFYDVLAPIEVTVELCGPESRASTVFRQCHGEPGFDGRRVKVSYVEIESAAAGRGVYADESLSAKLTAGGTRHNAAASVNLLAKINELYENGQIPFEQRVSVQADGRQILHLILAVDEPEVHLHPYMQRSLINHYKGLLAGKDPEFDFMLKQLFGIDGIDGQLVIVTHSTDALVGDYRNLIRFYREGGKTAVVSGSNPGLRFSADSEKHMIMRFPEIKEAFYANCALLIEGETEYGCIAGFAEKLGVSLDDLGICLINARGEGSIRPLRQLLAAFAVSSVAIFDGDVRDGQNAHQDEFYTRELCFEIEIVSTLFSRKRQSLARKIVNELDKNAQNHSLSTGFAQRYFKKMGVKKPRAKRLADVSDRDRDEFVAMFSAWMMARKGVMLGRIIGGILPASAIPDCYRGAIRRASEVALDAARA